MRKNAGFSLMEALILLIVSALLILASFPVITRKNMFQGKNASVIKCIQKEGAAKLNSPDCAATIKGSLYNRNNYLDTLLMFVDDPAYTSQGLKVLKEVCDEGGKPACNKIIDICSKDNKCNLGENNDISFYLKLLPNSSNLSMAYMIDTIAGYYNVGMSNIKAMVDSTCCNPDLNMACAIKGILSCNIGPWEDEIAAGSTANDIAIDSSGNAYVLITTSNKVSIVKLKPNGGKDWDVTVNGIISANQIIVGKDNNIYAVGTVAGPYSEYPDDTDIALIKVSPDGTFQWAKRYCDDFILKEVGMGLTTSMVEGNIYIYIIGYAHNRSYQDAYNNLYELKDLRLIKVNTDGTIKSYKTYTPTDTTQLYTQHKGVSVVVEKEEGKEAYLYFAEIYCAPDSPTKTHLLVGRVLEDLTQTNTITTSAITQLISTTVTGMAASIDGSTLYVIGNDQSTGIMAVYSTADAKITKVYKFDTIMLNRVTVDINGRIYLVGTNNSSTAIICLDNDEKLLWKRLLTGSGSTSGVGINIIKDVSGNEYSYIAVHSDNNNTYALKLPSPLNDNGSLSITTPIPTYSVSADTASNLLKEDPVPPVSVSGIDTSTSKGIFNVTSLNNLSSKYFLYN